MSVLQTIDLKKYYGTKPNITRALDGELLRGDGEFVFVGNICRQIHLTSHDGRAGHTYFRQCDCPGQRTVKNER